MAHLRRPLKGGAVGLPEEDGRRERGRGRKVNLSGSSHHGIRVKSKKSTSNTKTNEIIKSVALGIVCEAILQLLFVSFLLSEETDEWNASEAFTKTRSFGGGRGGNDDGTKLDNILEDITHDIDGSAQYEPKMKLNAFGYVYWHRDPGEGVVNWHSSLAEVLRFARAHRRTLISPCVRNGQLKPCVYDTDDASSLRTSTCRTKRVGCKYPRKRREKDLEVEEDLSSDVMRPMTLAQYYDQGRLKSYVDDMVSYEQFAERFFERILEDEREEGRS